MDELGLVLMLTNATNGPLYKYDVLPCVFLKDHQKYFKCYFKFRCLRTYNLLIYCQYLILIGSYLQDLEFK